MRKIAWLFTLGLLAAGCGRSDSTNAGPSPKQTPQASKASGSATPDLDPIVGEWLRANTCQDLVRALAKQGLQEFAAQSVGGAVLLTTPENVPAKDPKHPCADAAGPIVHSHKFWADGTFNSYNQFGEQVDDDEYEMVDESTIMFAGFDIDYEVEGDTIVFSFTVPKSCTSNGCRQRAAYAVNVFYPGEAWERVSCLPRAARQMGSGRRQRPSAARRFSQPLIRPQRSSRR